MKIEVFNEETVPKPVLRLRLRKTGEDVDLIAVVERAKKTRWNDGDRMQVCH